MDQAVGLSRGKVGMISPHPPWADGTLSYASQTQRILQLRFSTAPGKEPEVGLTLV